MGISFLCLFATQFVSKAQSSHTHPHYFLISRTTELLRDYGFVENYPRRFSVVPDFFSMEENEDDETTAEKLLKARNLPIPDERYYQPYKRMQFDVSYDPDGVLDVEWRADVFWKKADKEELGMNLLEQWLNQVKFKRQHLQSDHYSHLPAHELRAIKQYNDALIEALGVAGNSLVADEDEVVIPDLASPVDPLCNDQVCVDHYDEMHWRFAHLDYLDPTCDRDEVMKFLDYTVMEEIQTHYQFMTFFERHEPFHDVCMDLDDIVQICSQYRPQYHEPSTHLAARYLDEVKRIVFIGGGDSMLLHESLKYPNIEKVLGLELDQTVVRKSFKYFATQPHFDDDRVEWWFGDAVKSLLLLPKSYWQTFDLVLVDLSETVMSFSVTKELDIFAALTLLMKPDGVMVKNELYLDQMSTIFDRSMQIHYPSGIICSQAMAMGSNKHDFFRDEPKDHFVETLLLKPANETVPYTWFHDTFMNSAWNDGKCNSAGQEPIPEIQEASAGILFVVDAEKTGSLDGMETKLYDVVKKIGLTPISKPKKSFSDVSFVVMEEGYIVARTWKNDNYVAYDIHLWSAFDQHVPLRDALTAAVDSKLASSFRVVAGGMFGAKEWRKDAEGMGPQHAEMRDCTPPKQYTEEQKEEPLVTTINEFMDMYFDEKVTAMVVCGFKSEKCIWKDILEKHGNVEKLHVFYSCPSLEGKTPQDALPHMHACESEVFSFMMNLKEKLDVFILDGNVGFDMGSVMNSIWSLEANRKRFMREERSSMISMGTNLSPDRDTWQRNFVDRYRTNIDRDPLFRSEIIVATEHSETEIGVCTHNDREIIPRMKAYEDSIRAKIGDAANVTVRKIVGGRFEFQENYNPPMYDFEEYDSAPARAQFAEQKPMGRETIFQYNVAADEPAATMPPVEKLQDCLKAALATIKIIDPTFDMYKKVGVADGAVITSTFPAGHAVLVWDGRTHVDVNLFNFDDEIDVANDFNDAFMEASNGNLDIGLRDDLPRGTGRVINFKEDLTSPMPPQPWPVGDDDDGNADIYVD